MNNINKLNGNFCLSYQKCERGGYKPPLRIIICACGGEVSGLLYRTSVRL
ncbi:MAG: hypothetical protein FWG43_06635 [Clostridiales bacterium]|nr:hypothetical protein [Clostridiales bacterium]